MRKIKILRLLFTSHCLNLQHWISLITLLYSWFSRALFCISGVKLPGAPVYLSPLALIKSHSIALEIISILYAYDMNSVMFGWEGGRGQRDKVVCLRPSPVSSIPPWNRLRTFVRSMLIVRGWIPTPFIHWRQQHHHYNFIPPRTKKKKRVYTCSGTKEQHVPRCIYTICDNILFIWVYIHLL